MLSAVGAKLLAGVAAQMFPDLQGMLSGDEGGGGEGEENSKIEDIGDLLYNGDFTEEQLNNIEIIIKKIQSDGIQTKE